ncbi:diguanylate cyclase [Escherichia coli]|nr:diguanylate cyclase [Escherichia coli]EFO1922706.1 diguanylate cyclase [Escherichia coli]MJR67526.1 diguanylate cyclase [Escherichia coli]OXK66509.1 diguanylate cyclase [Escherichia coli]OXK67249.1 diguanylate cyclase [Escherichia coli]
MGATVPALCVTVRKLSDIFIYSERIKCNMFYHFMIQEKACFLDQTMIRATFFS